MARKRGKPSFGIDRLSRMIRASTPDDQSDPLFVDLETPFGLIEELEAGSKLEALSSLVAKRLEKAGNDAMTRFMRDDDLSADLAWARPWSSSASTESVLRSAEASHYANERVITALTAHLVEHLVVREDLGRVMESARRRANDEAGGLPEYMQVFAQALMDSGMGSRDVKNISKRRISAIVEMVRSGSAALADDDRGTLGGPSGRVGDGGRDGGGTADGAYSASRRTNDDGGPGGAGTSERAYNASRRTNGDGGFEGDDGGVPEGSSDAAPGLVLRDAELTQFPVHDGFAPPGNLVLRDVELAQGGDSEVVPSDVTDGVSGALERDDSAPSPTSGEGRPDDAGVTGSELETPSCSVESGPSAGPVGDRSVDATAPVSKPSDRASITLFDAIPEVGDDSETGMGDGPDGRVPHPDGGPSDGVSTPVGSGTVPARETSAGPASVQVPVVPAGPAGRWDSFDLGDLPYRISERIASSEEDAAALRFRLPEQGGMRDLPGVVGVLNALATQALNERDGRVGERFVTRWAERAKVPLTDEEVRIWCFLLMELKHIRAGDSMTPAGWYHGLILPGPVGTARVRQLVSTDAGAAASEHRFRAV